MKIIAREYFKEIRVKKGYSLTALSKLMNVSTSVVFSMENRNNVHPKTAKKACSALGEPFEHLFTIVD